MLPMPVPPMELLAGDDAALHTLAWPRLPERGEVTPVIIPCRLGDVVMNVETLRAPFETDVLDVAPVCTLRAGLRPPKLEGLRGRPLPRPLWGEETLRL